MSVEARIRQKKEAVDLELRRILSAEDSLLFETMRRSVFSGGKRFRPLLALCSAECFGVPRDAVLPFACGLELIHNYSLIHDDLPSMDNDDFRRGQPSCHKAFGEGVALLAGDSLLTLAFEVMAQAALNAGPKKEKVIEEISVLAGVRGMIGGQLMDITLSPEKISEEVFEELALKKTGSLIIASVKTGAILGDARPFELEAIVTYGKNVGLAFQLRDDILDSAEKEEKSHPPRPNAVSVFGLEESKQRLKIHVEAAIKALDEASLESEELRYLASRLLELK